MTGIRLGTFGVWLALMLVASAHGDLILDGSFETPSYGYYEYHYAVTGTAWDFASGSGITYLPSAWDGGRSAPDGTQVAFIQGATASLSQAFSASAGSYVLSFIDAGRPNLGSYGGDLTYQVLVNNAVVQSLSTVSGQAFDNKTINISLNTGNNTLEFRGLSANNLNHNGDDSAFIDKVTVTAVPEPTTMIAGAMLLLPFGASTLRMMRKNRTA